MNDTLRLQYIVPMQERIDFVVGFDLFFGIFAHLLEMRTVLFGIFGADLQKFARKIHHWGDMEAHLAQLDRHILRFPDESNLEVGARFPPIPR